MKHCIAVANETFLLLALVEGTVILGMGENFKRKSNSKKLKEDEILDSSLEFTDLNPSAPINWENVPDFNWMKLMRALLRVICGFLSIKSFVKYFLKSSA
ncbi:hypothetical protein HK098_004519 [Nowakowskiella sp. JEL0407]|nr:hypothetical protein HK098_004519 [Nowakowskiella sp. JEL0407]